MPLYKVTREGVSYDELASVVVADSEFDARSLVSAEHQNEDSDVWFDSGIVRVEEVNTLVRGVVHTHLNFR